MTHAVLVAAAAIAAAWLIALTLRRLVLLWASGRASPRPPGDDRELPGVTLVVAAHNEAEACPGLLAALEGLQYPSARLALVLVSDGSTDATAALFSRWTGTRNHARTIVLASRHGKAHALNEALTAVSTGIVAVLDADMRPRPPYLRELVRAFSEPLVGGAAGLIHPADAEVNLVTRYAAAETWLHQLVTSLGKDRLGLNPPTLGASAYRVAALRSIGGFPPVPHGTDVATSVALTRAGWQTRFTPSAVVDTGVVRTLGEYWRQHVRWSRGSFTAFRSRAAGEALPASPPGSAPAPARVTLSRRVDTWILCASYLDRVMLMSAVVLVAAGVLPAWLPAGYLAVPALEAWVALRRAGVRRGRRWRYLGSMAVMFPLDAAASLGAALIHAAGRPARWQSPARYTPTPHPPVGGP